MPLKRGKLAENQHGALGANRPIVGVPIFLERYEKAPPFLIVAAAHFMRPALPHGLPADTAEIIQRKAMYIQLPIQDAGM